MLMNMSSLMSGKSCAVDLAQDLGRRELPRASPRSTLRHMAMISDAGTPLPETSAMATPQWSSSTGM